MDAPKTRRENEVWQACDDLWALNNNLEALKGDLIREQLLKLGYKKGSPNEIYKYRTSWKESRGISEKTPGEKLEIADPISRAVRLVYEQLKQENEQKICAVESDAKNQLEALNQKNQDFKNTLEKIEAEQKELFLEKNNLQSSLESLRKELQETQKDNKELKLRLEAAQLLSSELKATYTEQIEVLERKLKDQGLVSSEKINEAKLETRYERDLRMQAEGLLKRITKESEKALRQEFQKLAVLVKKIKIPKKIASKQKTPCLGLKE